jgi:AP-2 complex subunit mu-1
LFRLSVVAAKEANVPIVKIEDCSFLYIRHGDIYVVAVSKSNTNPCLVFEFLFKLVEVFKAYFSGSFDEEKIRSNFVLIYELLDETMDYGYPQIVQAMSLKQFIKVGAVKEQLDKISEPVDNNRITSEITGAIDWRQPGKFRYRKNEVFIDVYESVNLLLSSDCT